MSLRRISLSVAAVALVCLISGSPLRAAIILSNLPGSGSYTTSGLAFSSNLSDQGAVGVTIGSTPETFTSISDYFANTGTDNLGYETGGIYTDGGGHPSSSEVVSFSFATANTTPSLVTLTPASSVTLSANTTYWFVLRWGSAIHVGFTAAWDEDSANTVPTADPGDTFVSYLYTTNTGGSWTSTAANPTVTINATPVAVPEPASLAVIGVPAAMGLLRRRRKQV